MICYFGTSLSQELNDETVWAKKTGVEFDSWNWTKTNQNKTQLLFTSSM